MGRKNGEEKSKQESCMGEEKIERRDSVSVVAGIFSIIFILVEVIGVIILIGEGRFPIGIMDVLIFLYSAYVFDKTLYEGKNLTAWEIAIFVVMALITFFYIFVGFLIGFTSVV
jgi:hypothetical protein